MEIHPEEAPPRTPPHEIRLGRVKAKLWPRRREDGTVWYDTRIVRLYKDGQGHWQESASHNPEDLLLVSKAAHMAFDWISQQRYTPAELSSADEPSDHL